MWLYAKHRSDRQNNFNLLRIIAALAVLVSHAYPIALGPGTPEPLAGVLGINLGEVAVLMFFAISGYFISRSFHNKRSILEFVVARILRIYPALLAVLGSNRIPSRAIIYQLNSRRILLGSSNATLHSKEPAPLADAI